VDVVIPAHQKDFPALRSTVMGLIRHVPLRRVVVVASRRFRWADDRVTWCPEPPESVLPSPQALAQRSLSPGQDLTARAGWIYQQLLKLGARQYVDGLSGTYLAVDADVIFLRPTSFALPAGKRFLYSLGFEHYPAYRPPYERLFLRPPRVEHSMVAHHMMFDGGLLAEMFDEIEGTHQIPWYEAYLDAVDRDEPSPISEWNLYGWWVLDRHPDVAAHRQLQWQDVKVLPGALGRSIWAADFDFVAAHAWARESRVRRAFGFGARLAGECGRALRPGRRPRARAIVP
jgi:Family of unknown function (DUF6492)